MNTDSTYVPENPERHGFDVLGSGLEARGHFIHEVLARATIPLTAAEIGSAAKELAQERGVSFTARTFDTDVTGNHLRQYLRDKVGYAEQLEDRRWRLTKAARDMIAGASAGRPPVPSAAPAAPDVRAVDAKSRVLLPADFANATVTVERVGDNEVRIRKAVVVPVDELPLMEAALAPLSDRDRDLVLELLDNPPAPNASLQKALRLHKERHG